MLREHFMHFVQRTRQMLLRRSSSCTLSSIGSDYASKVVSVIYASTSITPFIFQRGLYLQTETQQICYSKGFKCVNITFKITYAEKVKTRPCVAQAVSRRLPTAVARVKSCGVYGR
jgi:hypothetical protein